LRPRGWPAALAVAALLAGAAWWAAAGSGPARDGSPADGPGATLEGVVVRVVDGDTLTLRVGPVSHRVRLAQIDAPERAQPWSRRARRALDEIAAGRRARVEVVDIDDYGRLVGEVFVDGVHVNREMVRRGHAWAYTRYARSTAILEDQDEAREAGRGLWSLPPSERQPPWEWRHGGAPRAAPPAPAACGPKRFCREMESCAEARRYLACGLSTIDGDGDGTPCETLCRE